MKKSIVFVIPSLAAGGGEKSLVNLLNCIDFRLYDVDLILFKKQGIFLNSIPKEVTIVPIQGDYIDFTKGLFQSITAFFIKFKMRLLAHRLSFYIKNKRITNKAKAEQYSWINISSSIPSFPKKYDAAIAFLEKSSVYFTVEKINAPLKIGWIHTNYSSSGMSSKFDSPYFSQLKALIAVSPECNDNLKLNFHEFSSKIATIYNVVSPDIIRSLSQKTENIDGRFNDGVPILVTVARLSQEKGCDLAIEAGRIMKENDLAFKWFIIGEGSERVKLENKINEYKLGEHVFLIGLKENPYPYVSGCTIYVQPSRYEGKSIAIEEAKILLKPIVVTDFSTAKDQIESGRTGIIAEMTATGLATTIQNLLDNTELQMQLSSNLANEDLGTENEINKLYTILNE